MTINLKSFWVKSFLAIVMATIIWWIAYYTGQNPRGLDWWILFSLEYAGATLIYMQSKVG